MRRLALLLFAIGLAATAWFVARRDPPREEGLVAWVRLVDDRDAPVHPAQVERVYDQERVTVDAGGSARLAGVRLRAGDAPSPEAFAAALEPIARYHALPPGTLPDVRRRDDGAWEVRFRMRPCGLLRVHVNATHLGPCKAFVAPSVPRDRWMRVGAHEVVRSGSVVDFRIFEGEAPILLRLEGEPGAEGVATVATRHYGVAPPSPGHVRQFEIEPEPVLPILGQILPGEGPRPPSLTGTVEVLEGLGELDGEARMAAWGAVPVTEDGSFVIRTTGDAPYRLRARLAAYPEPFELATRGGEIVELRPETPPQWLVLEHPGLGGLRTLDRTGPERPVAWRIVDVATGAPAARAQVFRTESDRTLVGLGARGRFLVEGTLPGSPTEPPFGAGPVEVDALGSGELRASLDFVMLPHATVVVRTTPESWEGVRSARVVVDGRGASLVAGTAQSAELKFVRAGSREIRIEWNDGLGTVTTRRVEVLRGGTQEFTLSREPAAGPR